MRLFRILAITLVISSHVSLCAGSVFSVAMAMAASVAHASAAVQAMTPAIGGDLCMLQTPSAEVPQQSEKEGCGAGKRCSGAPALALEQSKDNGHGYELASFQTMDLSLSTFIHAYSPLHSVIRDRPPDPEPHLLAYSVVRRE